MRVLLSLAIVILGSISGIYGQSRAVGVAMDPVEAEYENAKAITAESRAQYDRKMADLAGQIAAGRVAKNRAPLLQRLFYLDVLEAEAKEATAYSRMVEAAAVKLEADKGILADALRQTDAVLHQLGNEHRVLLRDLRSSRGPAMLTILEFERIMGEKLMDTGDDAAIIEDLERTLKEAEFALEQGRQEQQKLAARLKWIEQSGPALEARRSLARQRQEILRTRTILVRAGSSADTPLPPLPEFKPLPGMFNGSSTPGQPPVAADEEQLRRRIKKENLWN